MSLSHIKQFVDLKCALRFRRLLSPYIDGELDEQARVEMEGHLETCSKCREEYADMLFASRLASNLSLPDKQPAGIPLSLKQKLSNARHPQDNRSPRIPVPLAAACLLIIAAAAAFYYIRKPEGSWEVVRLAGSPTIASDAIARTGRLGVGQWLETDDASRAMIQVGGIGHVEIDPDSRVRLVEASPSEHRLSLERGRLHASILAPPRLFFVETPSAVAVDLGCSYTLQVDDEGASLLRVRSGWVALTLNGRESLVPAGASCRTKPGIGPGTPYLEDSTDVFRNSLTLLDFEGGGTDALQVVLKEARPMDSLTLWHLLVRVEVEERVLVYSRLAALVPPPDGVSREGVLALDRKTLNLWREKIEYVSVGVDPGNVPAATGSLKPVGSMNSARFSHTATLLSDGRVLIAGGRAREGVILNSAENYDPNTGVFTETGSMTAHRIGHTATLLPEGKVLIAGGSDRSFYQGALSSAELYDPATGTFTRTGSMSATRLAHRAILMPDGKVLITGGQSSDWNKQTTSELYDPATGSFTATGSMSISRADHTATLLKDGKVLLTGGASGNYFSEAVTASAEVYDPAKGAFAPAGDMTSARHKHSAELLPDGQVIIMGGADSRYLRVLYASAEIFDPAKRAFAPAGNMRTSRYKIRDAVVLLNNGKVLIAGGGARLEVYDPDTGIFGAVAGEMGAARYYSTATKLANGDVLISGGYSGGVLANASAWVYSQ